MATDETDGHPGIPRDANGVPIFFILPPDVRASYDRKMKACERAWQQTRDPLAVGEAISWASTHRQPLPAWLEDDPGWLETAVWTLAVKRRGKTHATRAHNAAVRLRHYEYVRDAHASGLSLWEGTEGNAYQQAAKWAASTPWAAKAGTMKAHYNRVKDDLNAGRGGLYFTPQWHRYFRPKELRERPDRAARRALPPQ